MTDEPDPMTAMLSGTHADMIRAAAAGVLAFGKYATDVSPTLAVQLGIVCGAALTHAKALEREAPGMPT